MVTSFLLDLAKCKNYSSIFHCWYVILENRHPVKRNMVTVQIWLDYQPFTGLISLNYRSFIGYKWNISKIQLKYKGDADSVFDNDFVKQCWAIFIIYDISKLFLSTAKIHVMVMCMHLSDKATRTILIQWKWGILHVLAYSLNLTVLRKYTYFATF